jgi:hypothetical protein
MASAKLSVTWDMYSISATSKGAVTRDGRTIRNGTVEYQSLANTAIELDVYERNPTLFPVVQSAVRKSPAIESVPA